MADPASRGEFDVVPSAAGFALKGPAGPVLTSGGRPMEHASERLLTHALRELVLGVGPEARRPGACALLEFLEDCLGQGHDPLLDIFDDAAAADPILHRLAGQVGAGSAIRNSESALDFLQRHGPAISVAFESAFQAVRSLNELLMSNGIQPVGQGVAVAGQMLRGLYAGLDPERRSAVNVVGLAHEAGIALPLLLVLGRISASEYAGSLFAVHMPGVDTVSASAALRRGVRRAADPAGLGSARREFRRVPNTSCCSARLPDLSAVRRRAAAGL